MSGASRSKKKKMVRCDTDQAGSITDFHDRHTALAGMSDFNAFL